ncbi:MAG: hypothetical protein WA822_02320 [Albidovulum sp.]
MVERKAVARARDAEGLGRPDPLDYWYQQEITPFDSGDPSYAPPAPVDDEPMVSGWWILPVLVLSVPAWVMVWMVVF